MPSNRTPLLQHSALGRPGIAEKVFGCAQFRFKSIQKFFNIYVHIYVYI